MTGWTSTWATNLGAGVRTATLMLALLQGMMMIGRLLAAPVLRVVSKTQLVLASAIGGFLSVAILLAAKSIPMLALGAGLAGLTFAAIYPTVLALAGDRYQRYAGLTFAAIYPTVLALAGDRYQRYAATVFGILFTIGISGGMFYPWAIGHISQSLGLRAGMFLPLVGTAAITVIMLMLRAKHPPPPHQSL